MLNQEHFTTPGEHSLFIDGEVGQLETILSVPERSDTTFIALLGHPHSLQGGTMHNKVVTTLARSLRDLNIASIRFNFRGVGNSSGEYDGGLGESRDMIVIAKECLKSYPHSQLIIAGFSFGSYVAYRAAASLAHALLISIAPAVHHYDYNALGRPPRWHILQGDADEVVSFNDVHAFAEQAKPPIPITRFERTGHFFHGQLLALRSNLIRIIQQEITANE